MKPARHHWRYIICLHLLSLISAQPGRASHNKNNKNNDNNNEQNVDVVSGDASYGDIRHSADLAALWVRANDDVDLQSRSGNSDNALGGQQTDLSREQQILVSLADIALNRSAYLYDVLEPSIYLTGLTVGKNEPASYLAAFNKQSTRAKYLAKFAHASVHTTRLITEKFGLARARSSQLLHEVSVHGTQLHRQCPTKNRHRLKPCPPLSEYYRLADGRCNNRQSQYLGSAMTPFQRFLPADYSDGVQQVRVSVDARRQLPSARDVSVTLHRDVNLTSNRITTMLMQWGQFIDHDITSSAQTTGFNGSVPRCCLAGGVAGGTHPDCMPISVPHYDSFYSRYNITCMEFVRSSPAPRSDCTLGPREQINQITSFIDASAVYGSSLQEMHNLRLFNDGMLKYSALRARKPLLPAQHGGDSGGGEGGECRMTNTRLHCFSAGDNRVNEQPGLASMHTVWLREHNRLARRLSLLNSHWSDERVFQESRRLLAAMLQVITYNEWLPLVLGRSVIEIFGAKLQRFGFFYGYNSSVNPSAANSFAAAAFRFGHSLVNSRLARCDKHGRFMHTDISLHKELMNPVQLYNIGSVDRLMFGLLFDRAQRRDVFISKQLTNHLFQTTEPYGLDLAAINIQRGRDHGLAPYVRWRQECGLKTFNNWAHLLDVMDDDSVARLRISYRHLEDIDLFAGGLAERPVKGGLVGPTFACIIGQQFANLKLGDRFWFENGGLVSSFTPSQLHQLRKTTLARVLCDNLDDIDTVRPLVMRTGAVSDRNRPVSCKLIRSVNLSPWIESVARPSDSFSSDPSSIHSSLPFASFQLTAKHGAEINISGTLHAADISQPESASERSHTRVPGDASETLREDQFSDGCDEASQPCLDELPHPLTSCHDANRPLYSLQQLAQLLASQQRQKQKTAAG